MSELAGVRAPVDVGASAPLVRRGRVHGEALGVVRPCLVAGGRGKFVLGFFSVAAAATAALGGEVF